MATLIYYDCSDHWGRVPHFPKAEVGKRPIATKRSMLRKYLPYYRRLLKLAMPLVLTQAGQMTVQLIDTAMVGRVGTPELAAASFANSIYVVIMLFGLGVFMGVTPLVGQARGAGTIAGGCHYEERFCPIRVADSSHHAYFMVAYLDHAAMGQTDEVVRLAVPVLPTSRSSPLFRSS